MFSEVTSERVRCHFQRRKTEFRDPRACRLRYNQHVIKSRWAHNGNRRHGRNKGKKQSVFGSTTHRDRLYSYSNQNHVPSAQV